MFFQAHCSQMKNKFLNHQRRSETFNVSEQCLLKGKYTEGIKAAQVPHPDEHRVSDCNEKNPLLL